MDITEARKWPRGQGATDSQHRSDAPFSHAGICMNTVMPACAFAVYEAPRLLASAHQQHFKYLCCRRCTPFMPATGREFELLHHMCLRSSLPVESFYRLTACRARKSPVKNPRSPEAAQLRHTKQRWHRHEGTRLPYNGPKLTCGKLLIVQLILRVPRACAQMPSICMLSLAPFLSHPLYLSHPRLHSATQRMHALPLYVNHALFLGSACCVHGIMSLHAPPCVSAS